MKVLTLCRRSGALNQTSNSLQWTNAGKTVWTEVYILHETPQPPVLLSPMKMVERHERQRSKGVLFLILFFKILLNVATVRVDMKGTRK